MLLIPMLKLIQFISHFPDDLKGCLLLYPAPVLYYQLKSLLNPLFFSKTIHKTDILTN